MVKTIGQSFIGFQFCNRYCLTASVLCGLDQDLHNALFFSGYSPSSSLDAVSWGSYKWCIMLGVVTIEAKGVAVAVVEPSLVGPSATFACEEIQSDIQWGGHV